MPSRLLALSLVAIGLAPRAAMAQCADGTPPPCRGAVAPTVKRATPQLNPRAWIVVPFGNITRAPELDWLRDASVNLLTLDLSRWTDISVVDDKRVGDLLRELPQAKGTTLTLGDGLALARLAGAGTLVMGDFYKLGNGARIAANVFDVRSGQRLRSVTQQAPNQDSLLTAFAPLARAVLALPVPTGVKLGATGTTSVDAYQEYLLGSSALNRFELTQAVSHLRKALSIDSTFAMAHYKLSVAFHWDSSDVVAERAQATAAARLGGTLPARERALIAGRVASSTGDDPRACATLRALVARDSMDVDALYGMGECEYHGGWIAPEPIDSVRGRFRGDWNAAITHFRRVLQLDPAYHPAFAHVLDMLSVGRITVCITPGAACANDSTSWSAVVIRDGDSLLIQPVRRLMTGEQLTRAERTNSRYLNFRAAQAIAKEWVDAGPSEARARVQLADIDMYLGDIDSAYVELRSVDARSDPSSRRSALIDRFMIDVVRGRGAGARANLDSARRETRDEASLLRDLGPMPMALLQGTAAARAIQAYVRLQGWSSERAAYSMALTRALVGLPSADLNEIERRYWVSLPGDSSCAAGVPRCRTTALMPSMAYAPRAPRTWWPPYAVPELGFRFMPARAIALGDTTLLRLAVKYLDSLSHSRTASTSDEQGTALIATEAALALRDSATALRLARYYTDSVSIAVGRSSAAVSVLTGWPLLHVPRMMLQRADLAAAMGHADEARTWYIKVLDLWSEADPEFQPTVTRIRAALARQSVIP